MKKTGFIINVFVMTASMLVIRLAGMVSNIYISARAGAEAMGLYHVIFSVYSFAVTVSVSGTGLAATRLISERSAKAPGADVSAILKKCMLLSLAASLFAASVLFFGAEAISKNIISDERCIPALKILAFSLPPIGACAVIRGYMIAFRRAGALTASQITEEFSSIFITVLILRKYAGTPYAYMSMIIGNAVSEFLAFALDFTFMRLSLGTRPVKKVSVRMREILSICVPVALGSYLRSGLVALENVMIPSMLSRYKIADPLSEYGLIRAMAMQILLFPTVFIQSFSSMLVPEMSEMNAAMRKNGIKYVSSLAVKFTLIFAFLSSALFFKYHDELSLALYKNERVGMYLGMLSFLAIPMYLDTVVDSMLKGLNQQVSSLKFNIADSILRVAAVWIFLPKFGMLAYIVLLYASEIFNLSLSIGKLISVSGLRIKLSESLLSPALCSAAAFFAADFFHFKSFVSEMIFFTALYMTAEYLLEALRKSEK